MSESAYTLSEDFLSDIERDTKINDLNLQEEATKVVNTTQRYIEELYRVKRKLHKVELEKKKIEGELFEKYKTNFEIKITSSQDVMRFVYRDKKYQTVARIAKELEVLVDFLEMTVKNMNQKPWLIQKLIDLEKGV